MSTLSEKDRDSIIRTIFGEARGESEDGMAAVAHVIKNRVEDRRWPNTADGVVKQKWQFSTWNPKDANLAKVKALSKTNRFYLTIGRIVDDVWAGRHDPTNGAVYYYAPLAMKPRNSQPKWWPDALKESGGVSVQIGNHHFAGRVQPKK